MTPSIEVATLPPSDPNTPGLTNLVGLGYVNFEIEPHCDQDRFAIVKSYASERGRKIYAIDDQTAIRVVDGVVDVVSEGAWELFDNSSNAIK